VPSRPPGAPRRARAATSVAALVALVALSLSGLPLPGPAARAAPGGGSYGTTIAFPWDQYDATVVVDPVARTFYGVSAYFGTFRVGDLDTGEVLDELELPSWHEGGDAVLDESTGIVYVGTAGLRTVLAYDPVDGSLREWSLDGDVDALALDEDRGLLYVGSHAQGRITALDLDDDGTVVRTVDAPGVRAVTVTSSGQVFVASVTDIARWSPGLAGREASAAALTDRIGGEGIAVDERTGRVFAVPVFGLDDDTGLWMLDAATLEVLGKAPLHGRGEEVVVDQTTDTVFVTQGTDVSVLDGATGSVVTTARTARPGGGYVRPVERPAVDEAANKLWFLSVTDSPSGTTDALASLDQPVSFAPGAATGVVPVGTVLDERLPGRGDGLTFRVASGALPTGTTLSRDGRLAGTATAPGAFAAEVVATSATGDTVRKTVRRSIAQVDRVQGDDRYATSAAVSRRAYPDGAETVFVASGAAFPDALAAGPVAARRGAPLLLSSPDGLTPATAAEITRLGARRVVLVGGEASLRPAVERSARGLRGVTEVTRVQGPDRFATSRALAALGGGSEDGTVFVATGRAFPDALSASAAAGALDAPLLLVDGAAAEIDRPTMAALADLGATRVVVVGGPASVTEDLVASIPVDVVRAAGPDRFATSVAVSSLVPSSTGHLVLATGTNFPDALAASAWAGHERHVLSIVRPECVPSVVLDAAGDRGTSAVTLVGGTVSLSPRVASLSSCG